MSKDNIIKFKDIAQNKKEDDSLEKDNSKKNRLKFKNIFILAIIVISIVYPAAYIGNQMVAMSNLKKNIEQLEKELSDIKTENKTMQSEIANSKSNEFIEKMAREKLKMVKKDETVYIKID